MGREKENGGTQRMIFKSVAILGSGSFGTAIAKLLSPKVGEILIIGREEDVARGINSEHRDRKSVV